MSEAPKYWTNIIIRGRGDKREWVSSIRVQFSLDMKVWMNVDNIESIAANLGPEETVLIPFKTPAYGRILRIYPLQYSGHFSLRFEALFIDPK